MNSILADWKTLLVLIAASLVLFVGSLRFTASHSASAAQGTPAGAAAHDADTGPAPSNEIDEFQQLG